MTLASGTRLGPYEVIAPIGAGGMGEVYRARDPRLGRDVAIKIVPESGGADARGRFEQEARAVAALSHPNVLAIFDVGMGKRPFLVTELLDGETLRAVLQRGPLSAARVIDLGLQIAAGLTAAHEHDITHRDLKPENLFVTREGRLKILDFGLAKWRDESDVSVTALTRPGVLLGTTGYMAPEVIRGAPADARSDLFATGAILFEMLTGRRAFEGPSAADVIAAVLQRRKVHLEPASGVPVGLGRIVERCLEHDPDARFQSARELAAALESLSDPRTDRVVAPTYAATYTSIAVLPFVNLTAQVENDYFADGLTEDLISALANLPGLRVASPTSSFRFRSRDVDVRRIGGELTADVILEGSVRRHGERLRITTRLTDVSTGYQISSQRFDRRLVDVFDVQDEIIEAIVQATAPALVPLAKAAAHHATRNLEAYELYLKGRRLWAQRSPGAVPVALRCFEQAIALDPEYALPHAGLADVYTILHVYGWMPPERCRVAARDAVARALELEPELADAHLSRALYTFHFEPHWRTAHASFERAVAARPRMAAAHAHCAVFLATAGDLPAARERAAQAIALEPHASQVHFLAACTDCLAGDWDAAERHAARALELEPESLGPRWPQTVALLMSNRVDQAFAVADVVIARSRAPIFLGVLGMAYARAGRLADARQVLRELDERRSRGEFVAPAAYLSVQLGLRSRPAVIDALRACIESGVAPMSILATSRFLLEDYADDPEAGKLLDRLEDRASGS